MGLFTVYCLLSHVLFLNFVTYSSSMNSATSKVWRRTHCEEISYTSGCEDEDVDAKCMRM